MNCCARHDVFDARAKPLTAGASEVVKGMRTAGNSQGESCVLLAGDVRSTAMGAVGTAIDAISARRRDWT